jgi:trimeric autotransporter adhesin
MSFTRVLLIAIVTLSAACGQAPTRPTVTEQPPITTVPSSPTPAVLSISSLSPATAAAGSADITVTITGSGFQPPQIATASSCFAVWSDDIILNTRYLSDTQLTAVIPASLLKDPASAQVIVVNGQTMGWSDGYTGYPRSNALSFTIVGSR